MKGELDKVVSLLICEDEMDLVVLDMILLGKLGMDLEILEEDSTDTSVLDLEPSPHISSISQQQSPV